MKMKLKLTADEIVFLESKTDMLATVNLNLIDKSKKTALSILVDVAEKVSKKSRSLIREDYHSGKKHSVSLKWHEIQFLHSYLLDFNSDDLSPYNSIMSRNIIAQLDQKLA